MSNPGDKITPAEMIALFGERVPLAVADFLFNAPAHMTIAEVRAEVRRMAAEQPALQGTAEFAAACREQAQYQGPEGLWVVWFQEPGVGPVVFHGAGAEGAARTYHRHARGAWSCGLLCGAELLPVSDAPQLPQDDA
ncbi:hypothetical protein UFOVP326_109 [uncultured Caudovirales phage]|uniref:Uncharacterized protein n=1 Tax=uncultured Caudovirales phage TaxID=2100421 RepID=A0A6J5LY73_9CAUD|nr:hypothetical protein UFOVP326_109 [uncultured Caudovirales phage]